MKYTLKQILRHELVSGNNPTQNLFRLYIVVGIVGQKYDGFTNTEVADVIVDKNKKPDELPAIFEKAANDYITQKYQ